MRPEKRRAGRRIRKARRQWRTLNQKAGAFTKSMQAFGLAITATTGYIMAAAAIMGDPISPPPDGESDG